MASLLKSLRWLTREHSDLITLASRLNDEIKPDLLSGQFITGAFIALIIYRTTLSYCSLATIRLY